MENGIPEFFDLPAGCAGLSFETIESVQEVIEQYGGTVVSDGLFRIYDQAQSAAAEATVVASAPQWRDRLDVFAGDWLGRQWAVDKATLHERGSKTIRLLDPEEGGYEVPGPLSQLLRLFAEMGPDLFLVDLYRHWRATDHRPLEADTCIGVRVPLALGGEMAVDNLERTDLSVYWGLTTQIAQQVADESDGMPIRFHIDE